MSETCRKPKCSNPALPGKKLCAYHKAERDAKVGRAINYAGKAAKEIGKLLVLLLPLILPKGKPKGKTKRK